MISVDRLQARSLAIRASFQASRKPQCRQAFPLDEAPNPRLLHLGHCKSASAITRVTATPFPTPQTTNAIHRSCPRNHNPAQPASASTTPRISARRRRSYVWKTSLCRASMTRQDTTPLSRPCDHAPWEAAAAEGHPDEARALVAQAISAREPCLAFWKLPARKAFWQDQEGATLLLEDSQHQRR